MSDLNGSGLCIMTSIEFYCVICDEKRELYYDHMPSITQEKLKEVADNIDWLYLSPVEVYCPRCLGIHRQITKALEKRNETSTID